jgi:PAS domain S-box-containing protein
MTDQMPFRRNAASALLPAATAVLAVGVFMAEAMTTMKLTIAICYVIVVLLAGRFSSARGIVLVGAGCMALTLVAFFLPGFSETEAGGVGIKASISALVIGLTTFLVVERHRATDALREGEAHWREVFEHNPVMYFIVNPTGTVLSVNGFGAAQLGFTSSELIGQSVLCVFLEEDREFGKAQLAACAEELGRSRSWEIQKIRKDGTVLWVRENAKAVRRSANDVIVLIACEDITERKSNEQRRTAHFSVTRILAESDSLAAAAPRLLKEIGENLEWDWGALWSLDGEAAPLRCDCQWRAPHVETAEFDAVSREGTPRFHEGRIGHVWRSASPLWMVDATTEPQFLRAAAAAKAGLHGGVIFPILLDTEALGVVEFFSRAAREPDAEQLAVLSAIGSQIGQFIKRRRAEAGLRASEERWRRLFETSSAGMALFRLDGVCIAANPALRRILGLSEDEIVGHNVLELNHPDERAATAEALTRYRAGALTERNVEKKYVRKDGTPVWLNITNTLVPATETTPPLLQAVYVDVTAQLQAEAALRASEERWRAIFDSAAVGIAAGDLRGGLFDVNPTFQKMLGYTEEELRNLRDFEFTHEEDRAETRRLFAGVVSGQQPSYRLEKRYRRKDGPIVWADVTASTVPATENSPAFLAVMAIDITERKQAEAALREAEERFRTLVQFSFDVYWESDAQHRFIRQEFAEGVTDAPAPGSEIGKTRWEVPYVEPDEEAWRSHRETLDAHLPFRDFEHARPTPDGRKRYVSVSGLPVFDETGHFIGYRGVGRHITDRKLAEAALRASEERWRAMFETTAVGIATSDLRLRYLTANQSFQQMTGYTEAELRNRTPMDITHEDDRTEMLERIGELAAGPQRGHRFEKRLRRKDGEIVWADINTFFVPATDSTPAFLGGMAVDITDRKRAEAALRASEGRWRAMFETAPVGITMLDFGRRRYLAANECFQRMTGYTEGELLQLTALDVTHEDDRKAAQTRIDAGIIGGQQKRYRRKDGGVIWADVSAFVVPETDSTPAFLGAVIVDITDRKRAEAALRASEERWRTVFEAAAVGIATTDLEHRYITANETYQRMTGYTERELQNLTPEEITHGDDLAATRRFLDGIFTGLHRSYRIEKRYLRKDGEVVWADVNPFFVPATESTPALCAAIVVDITERKRVEEALREAEADLARLNRVMLLEEMAASIAHEVNQPIAAVMTNASAGLRWLGARQPNLDEVRQALNRIVRDGTRAGEVIGRVRGLVKKVPPRREFLDINDTIREVVALTQTEMQRHTVRLRTRLADNLPLFPADRVQLQQVIMNLIVNAVEAMSGAGNGLRELTITSGAGDGNIMFVEVRDTGPGLDPGSIDHLFQSFYTTKPDGIGMGLAISRSIAEAHGGRLSAMPNQPRGAVFRLTLPVEEQSSKGARNHRFC